ncbi:hypothetical protein [Blastococcus brunescens]|uniref:Uncharacterized protein n=1 Tax=Blastococcus brunescens TaxID=1564165 RepID=A0ABZ1B242_9ACTN|nr:hypothetical protein [Blastococcus sp. BMG 8361]WRL64814.1 hypothetical protein U6N30_03420 [Blastococcus sp. BMG 8361]
MLEAALAGGPDIDLELVTAEDPAMLLPGPWLAVAPRNRWWHDGRALATWTFDVPGGEDADRPAVTRLRLQDCRAVLAGVQEQVGDHSATWDALVEAEFQRSGRRTDLVSRVDAHFVRDFERRRTDVRPDRPYFTGTLAGGSGTWATPGTGRRPSTPSIRGATAPSSMH